jgi:O-antigen ligase
MLRRRIPFRRVRGTALFFFVLMAMLAVAAGPDILERKFETQDAYAGRREYTESSLAMIRDRPLLGFGLGTWSTVYPGYALFDDGLFVNQAHDDWAQWAAEGGLPFAAIMLTVAVWAARRGLRTGWGLGVTAVFVHCLVDYPIQRIGVSMVLFTMLAALASEDQIPGPAAAP